MRAIFLFLIIASHLVVGAQNYSIPKISSNTNGDPGPMKGKPGDTFVTTLTFSNSSSSVINVVMDRYKNELPAYWALCYCYIQCHDPKEDSILVEIQPLATTDVTLLFKTDSVNPGIANASFNVYEPGFESNTEKIHMTASTLSDVSTGIAEQGSQNSISVFPNPASEKILVSLLNDDLKQIAVFNISGDLIATKENFSGREITLNLADYPQGIYFVEVSTTTHKYNKYFVKQ